MIKFVSILMLGLAMAHCFTCRLLERHVVPADAIGVVVEREGVVSEAVPAGALWLWRGQSLLRYVMDTTMALQMAGLDRGGRRDPQRLILPGFATVVAAMRRASDRRCERLDGEEGVRACLRTIGQAVATALDARFGATLKVQAAWLGAPGLERIEVAIANAGARLH